MPDVDALTRRFQQRVNTIGARAAIATATTWANLPAHNDTDIPLFVTRATPILDAAKQASVSVAVAYFSLLVETSPPSVSVAEVAVADETREPFIAFWRALNSGRSPADALIAGRARAEAIARNLAVSSSRRAGDLTLTKTGHRPGSWRRVVDSDPCPWCQTVAGQTYRTAQSADFGHDRCGCSVAPNL